MVLVCRCPDSPLLRVAPLEDHQLGGEPPEARLPLPGGPLVVPVECIADPLVSSEYATPLSGRSVDDALEVPVPVGTDLHGVPDHNLLQTVVDEKVLKDKCGDLSVKPEVVSLEAARKPLTLVLDKFTPNQTNHRSVNPSMLAAKWMSTAEPF